MKENNKQVAFKLVGISTDDFSSKKENFNQVEEVEIGFSFDMGVNSEKKTIALQCKIEFLQNGNSFLNLKSTCHFGIEDESWKFYLDKKNNTITLPANFVTHLMVICIGTARGILHEIKPSWASNVLLPTIDVSNIVKEDPILNID